MKKAGTLKAVVAGLGRIGQLYDLGKKGMTATHAKAYAEHPGYALLAGIDPDAAKRRIFEKKFRRAAYADFKDLPAGMRPDVVSICLPTPLHVSAVRSAAALGPRAILCEKPLAVSAAEARVVIALCRKMKCLLAVNYMRRFEPAAQEIRGLLRSGKLGEPVKGTVWYGRGILNNGSHYINLLEDWIGPVREIQVLKKGAPDSDPSPDLRIRFAAADIYFLAFDPRYYTALNLELLTSKGKVSYFERGAETYYQLKARDPRFPGYEILGERHALKNDYYRYQRHVLDRLKRTLDGRENETLSDGASALATLKTVEQIRKKLERL